MGVGKICVQNDDTNEYAADKNVYASDADESKMRRGPANSVTGTATYYG